MSCKLGSLCTEECGGIRISKHVCPDGSEIWVNEGTLIPYEGDPSGLFPCMSCVDCTLLETCDMQADALSAPAQSSVNNFGLEITESERGNEGFSALVPTDPAATVPENGSIITQFTSAAGLPIPVPVAPVGSILSLQIAWGSEWNAIRGQNLLGDMTYNIAGSDVANDLQIHYNNTADAGMYGAVIIMDAVTGAAGSFVNVSAPNAIMAGLQTDFIGAINYQWHIIQADDGGAITTADYRASDDVQHGFGAIPSANNPHSSPDFLQADDCDGMAWTFGRHALDDGPNYIEAINDSGWSTFTGATDITSTVSWTNPAGSPCQLGMGFAAIDAGATWSAQVSGNREMADPAWIDQAWLHGGTFDCERSIAGGEPELSDVKAIDWQSVCDGTIECSLTGDMVVTVAAGETVLVTPIINGTADSSQAFTVTSSGAVPVNLNIPDESVTTDQTGQCAVQFEAQTTVGTSANSVDLSGLTMTVEYV